MVEKITIVDHTMWTQPTSMTDGRTDDRRQIYDD